MKELSKIKLLITLIVAFIFIGGIWGTIHYYSKYSNLLTESENKSSEKEIDDGNVHTHLAVFL